MASFERWGPVNFQEWDGEYDGVFTWATYGWSRVEGSLQATNELFRLTINQNPVGDAQYLGDRSLVAFITSEGGVQKLYFATYSYGFVSNDDMLNEYHEVPCTGKLTNWFYVYMGYSINKRAAMVYVKFSNNDNVDDSEQFQMTSLQFVPRYFGLYLARDSYAQYPGFQGEM